MVSAIKVQKVTPSMLSAKIYGFSFIFSTALLPKALWTFAAIFVEILNLDPITVTDEELKYVCRFLPTEVSEYNLSINDQQKFNSFYDEANKRFKQ